MNGELAIGRAELDAAVAAGILDRAAADRLLAFVAPVLPAQADEESLRLITGFNDIFVTIGLALLLGALTYMVSDAGTAATATIVAAASWALAEIFTNRKRMALPSIVLLVTFGAAAFTAIADLLLGDPNTVDFLAPGSAVITAVTGLGAAACIGLHWLRFRVPITVAAGCAALAVTPIALTVILVPGVVEDHPLAIFFPVGLAIFALAMRFDMSDRERRTRRTDIAFWLHLLAAPLIVHPVVITISSPIATTNADAAAVLALFAVLSLVALVIDRRALLVSSLGYLAYAAYTLLSATLWSDIGAAQAIFAVGATVLVLAVAWRPLRGGVLRLVPEPIRRWVPPAA